MPDRPARAAGIRWAEMALLMPMAFLLPFALLIVLVAMKSGVACFTGDTLHCHYAAEPAAQWWYHLKGFSFGAGGLLAGMALMFCVLVDSAFLQRRPMLARALFLALVIGLCVAVAAVVTSIGNRPAGWGEGWARALFVLSFTLLPVIVAVRHLPRVLRAAFPCHAVSHVQ